MYVLKVSVKDDKINIDGIQLFVGRSDFFVPMLELRPQADRIEKSHSCFLSRWVIDDI